MRAITINLTAEAETLLLQHTGRKSPAAAAAQFLRDGLAQVKAGSPAPDKKKPRATAAQVARALKESIADEKAGRVSPRFTTGRDALKWLESQ